MTLTRAARISREILLSSAAVLGVVCLVAVVAGFAFDVRPLMFRSGSMAPAIETGDLSISRTVDAADLHPGDIVSVVAADGERVTHRVVTSTPTDNHHQLTLKGDANTVVDDQVYDVVSAEKVLITLPKAGYVVDWLSRAPGVYLLALYVGLLLMVIGRVGPASGDGGKHAARDSGERRAPEASAAPPEASGRRGRRAGLLAAGVLGLALIPVAGWTIPTWAAWSDPSPVTGTTFSTGTWAVAPAAPTITSCTVSNGNSDTSITWTAASNPTSFEVRFLNNSNPAESFGGNLRAATLAAALNNTSGELWLVAIGPGGTSAESNHYTYSGNGGNRKCLPK